MISGSPAYASNNPDASATTSGPRTSPSKPEDADAAKQTDEHQQPVHPPAAGEQRRTQDVVDAADDGRPYCGQRQRFRHVPATAAVGWLFGTAAG